MPASADARVVGRADVLCDSCAAKLRLADVPVTTVR